MRRRMLSTLLCLALLLPAMSTAALAADDYGFTREGWYTDSHNQYGFMMDDTEIATNGEVPNIWYYDEVTTGSAVYVPIGVLNDSGNESRATFSRLSEKNDNVTVSYKATIGSDYVQSVTLVDGNKEKINGLPNGAYAKIQLSDSYTGTGDGVKIVVDLSLSVRGVYYPDTDTQLTIRMWNPLVYITRNTVVGAQTPTQFHSNYYNGEVTFDMGGGVTYLTTVSSNGKYVVNLSRAANETITANYPDAYLEFYNFRGNNDTFASTGRLSFPIDTTKFRDAQGNPVVYAYQIDGNTLRAIDSSTASYNANSKTLTLSTQTLGNYVLANRALHQTVSGGGNDDTFRSGYANQQQAETSQAEAQQAEVITATEAPAEPETQPEAQPETAGEAADAETAANDNDNPGTGAVISAANTGINENPATGPQRMTGLVGAAALLAAGVGAFYWKTQRPFAKKEEETQ